jgi:integrase
MSMSKTRARILSAYRQRVAAGEKHKLMAAELQDLIESFLGLLKGAQGKEEIAALCRAEMDLLEEGYARASVAKVHLPKYRNAIRAAMGEGRLPMTGETSRQYEYTKKGSGDMGVAHEHLALEFLKYDQATYVAIAGQAAQRNNAKQDTLRPVNPAVYLAKVRDLLGSENPFDLAVGVAAATGRRFSEVVAKGSLKTTELPFWVRFAGQLKKREIGGSFLTPCLVQAEEVMRALRRLRRHPRIAPLLGESPDRINRSLSNSCKRVVQRHFQLTEIVPVLEGEAAVSVHNLRGVYGEICIHFFCPPSRGVNRFVQERLGHVISEEELRRGNAAATQHYFHYYLVDEAGRHLGSRGVLLAEEALEVIPGTPGMREEIPPEPVDAVMPKDELATQVATLSVQLRLLQDQVAALGQKPALAMSGPEVGADEAETREIERLQAQVAATMAERDQVHAELRHAQDALAALQAQLIQERGAFQARIAGLVELLKVAPTELAPTEVEPPTAQDVQLALLAETSASKTNTTGRGRGNSGSADARVEAAMRAIMDWNNTHPRLADKWAITQSILQKTTGANMPAVKRVIDKCGMEIFEHNAAHSLNPDRHNFHKDLQQIKTFVLNKL